MFGVNTAIFSPSGGNVGIGFAIPSNLAKPVIDSLMRSGKVARGWLGVRIQSVTDEIAESLGLPETEGALVASVTPGGPAANAQIQAGDVILEFDGKTIDKMRSLPRLVAETAIGKDASGEALAQGPGDEPLRGPGRAARGRAAGRARPGAGGAVADRRRQHRRARRSPSPAWVPEQRTQFSLPEDAKGVVITDGRSTARRRPRRACKAGDLIVEVGQEEVGSPPEVTARVNQAKDEGKKSILLLIDRQGDLRFVALRFKE